MMCVGWAKREIIARGSSRASGRRMRGEVRQQALRQPVDAAGQGTVHEADMAAVPMDFERHGGGQLVGVGQCRRGQEGIVGGVQQ